ncbi:MAG: BamA/TamA family outer membrane protein [Bacteroidales bacterium]|jgi:outer membrane translocation and assembly module TamA|nr:BamA/TamA family outer membrane protein [Bacteroidales bacterium]
MIKIRTIYIGVLFFCFISFGNSHAKGQNIKLVFHSDFAPKYNKEFSDSISTTNYLTVLLEADEAAGYFNAGYDSIVYQDKMLNAYYFRGDKFSWGDITFIIEDSLETRIPTDKQIRKKSPSTALMRDYMEKIQSDFQAQGFANCIVESANLETKDKQVFWEIAVIPGNLYVLDSLIIQSDVDFPEAIIIYRAGLPQGSIYNPKRINELSRGIYDPKFVRQADDMKVVFFDSTYQIMLNYKKHTNNMISGMIGIVPGNETQNLYLTGDAKLQLSNAFKSAENIGFEWAAYEPLSQSLKIHYEHPVIYNALGIKSSFALEKQDSSYLNLNFSAGIQTIQHASELFVFYQWFQSSIVQNAGEIQNISDLSHRKIGLNYIRQKLDYPQNPSSGYLFNISGAAGLKQHGIDSVASEGLGEFESRLVWYIPLGDRLSLGLKNASGFRYLKNGLAQNEMYRLGGAQSFRAYHERSIFAGMYSFFTIEGIFFPDKTSSIYVFTDAGLFNQDLALHINRNGILFSIGVGLSVSTDVGILAISYGIPRNNIGGFDFRQSKIHIGYVNNF